MNRTDRFWTRVDTSGGPYACWPWDTPTSNGYGYFGNRGAHRFSYEIHRGPIPAKHDVDHICHTTACALVKDCPHRLCVNPFHLQAVTRKENLLRGNTVLRRGASGFCGRGHAYTADNLRVKKDGTKTCRRCAAITQREYRRAHGRMDTAKGRRQRELHHGID